MLTEADRKKYRMAIMGLKDQRKFSHIKISNLEKKKRGIDKEIGKIEKNLVKSGEMEKDLREEMKVAEGLPF